MKNYLAFIFLVFFVKFAFAQPVIEVQSPGLHKCVGESGELKITATGTQPLTYQWYHNGSPTGINTNILSFASFVAGDDGDYYCEVSNSEGSVTSDTIVLRIDSNMPTINDVSTQFNIVCLGTNNNFSVDYTGTNCAFIWWHGSDDVGHVQNYQLTNATLSDGGIYHCEVVNACGSVFSDNVEINVFGPPTITTQPQTTAVCEGGSIEFCVEAEGQYLNYLWKKNGENLLAEQASCLQLTNLSYPHSDVYSVYVYNTCGDITSNNVHATVNTVPTITGHPEDQIMCATDNVVLHGYGYSTTEVTYQWYNTYTGLIPNATDDNLTISISEGENTGYYFVLSGTCGTVTSNTAEIIGKKAPIVLTQPIGAELCVGENHTLLIKTEGTLPMTYQWQKNSADVFGDNITGIQEATMIITGINAGQAGNYHCVVTNECGSITSDTVEVIVNTPPSIIEFPQDMEFCEGQDFSLNVNTLGTEPLTIEWYVVGSETVVFEGSEFVFESALPEVSGDYYCKVSNICGEVSSEIISILVKALPEVIQNPIGAEICVGDSHEMSITATGEQPLSYLWYRNGSAISTETNSEIIISNAQINQTGIYFCRVANDCSYADSEEVEVIIGTPPAISWQPINQNLCEHQTLNLIMDAQGENYSLQWYQNDVPISGANDTVLNIQNLSLENAGNYYCLAYNACASVSTNIVEVVVKPSPEIDLGPDVELCDGETVTIGTDLPYSHYNWNNGLSHNQYLEVALGGTFILEVIGSNDCPNSDTIVVTFHPYHSLASIPDNIVSCGPYTINAGDGAYSYLWSNNATTSSITVNAPGTYSVTVTGDSFGCESTASIVVDLREPISFSLGNDVSAHVDTYVNIGIEHIFSEYLWNTGFTGSMLTVYGSEYGNGTHEFWLTAYALNGCTHTDTIKVTFYGQSGIEDEIANEISVYPNPASDFVIFESNDFLIENIEFYSVSGKLISKEIVNNWEVKYNLSSFAKGFYLVKIVGENNKIINTKILVQ